MPKGGEIILGGTNMNIFFNFSNYIWYVFKKYITSSSNPLLHRCLSTEQDDNPKKLKIKAWEEGRLKKWGDDTVKWTHTLWPLVLAPHPVWSAELIVCGGGASSTLTKRLKCWLFYKGFYGSISAFIPKWCFPSCFHLWSSPCQFMSVTSLRYE